jgi:hypothetical protein
MFVQHHLHFGHDSADQPCILAFRQVRADCTTSCLQGCGRGALDGVACADQPAFGIECHERPAALDQRSVKRGHDLTRLRRL